MKEGTFVLRIEQGTRDEVDERAQDEGISSSEWIRDAIEHYLTIDSRDDNPTVEEIEDMDWSELEDVISDNNLKVDADDFDTRTGLAGAFSNPDKDSEDTANLRGAVIEALESGDQEDE